MSNLARRIGLQLVRNPRRFLLVPENRDSYSLADEVGARRLAAGAIWSIASSVAESNWIKTCGK